MDDETGEKIPYAYTSYTRLNRPIEKYKVLIDACKEHMVGKSGESLLQNEEGFAYESIEEITYKSIDKAYRLKFSLKHHPDKRGDTRIFQAGTQAWRNLQGKLETDGLTLGYLKDVAEPLLTHLKTHLPQ